MTRFIRAPMINVNDESAKLCLWTKPDKSPVRKGEIVVVLETAKATFDLESEHDGYLRILQEAGTQVQTGAVIGAVCDEPNEELPKPEVPHATVVSHHERKITKKAEIVAARAGLDAVTMQTLLSSNGTITEADVLAYLAQAECITRPPLEVSDTVDDVYPQTRQQRILIVGGGRGAVQVLDSLSRIEHQRAVMILDDDPALHGKTIMGVPVVAGTAEIEFLAGEKRFDAAVVSVSTSIAFRERTYLRLRALNIEQANIIDPTARIQRNAVLGKGNVILAFCHVGSCTVLGNGNFLSPYVDIEHHSVVADFCTFGPGVMTSSSVRIGARVKFGTGIFVEPELAIGAGSVIGSGAILTRDIPENSIVKTKVNYTLRPRA